MCLSDRGLFRGGVRFSLRKFLVYLYDNYIGVIALPLFPVRGSPIEWVVFLTLCLSTFLIWKFVYVGYHVADI
jgi:hypothetical protein